MHIITRIAFYQNRIWFFCSCGTECTDLNDGWDDGEEWAHF